MYQIGQFLELWKNYNIGLEIWKLVVINWWRQYNIANICHQQQDWYFDVAVLVTKNMFVCKQLGVYPIQSSNFHKSKPTWHLFSMGTNLQIFEFFEVHSVENLLADS